MKTPAVITPLTKQQAFDLSVNGIRAQGYRRSLAHGTTCMYRSLEGEKCAVGHMIPDELYHPSLEGSTAAAFDGSDRYARGAVRAVTELLSAKDVCDLAQRLQRLHDGITPPWVDGRPLPDMIRQAFLFEQGFSRISDVHGLLYTPPPPVPPTGI
jgi:hypothetical protein